MPAPHSHHKRVLPPVIEPVVQQGLLNLALTGHKIVAPNGVQLTAVLIDSADEINVAYEDWLTRERHRTAIQTPEEVRARREFEAGRGGPRRAVSYNGPNTRQPQR